MAKPKKDRQQRDEIAQILRAYEAAGIGGLALAALESALLSEERTPKPPRYQKKRPRPPQNPKIGFNILPDELKEKLRDPVAIEVLLKRTDPQAMAQMLAAVFSPVPSRLGAPPKKTPERLRQLLIDAARAIELEGRPAKSAADLATMLRTHFKETWGKRKQDTVEREICDPSSGRK
jgi:hypothetical protein